jgi:hypothetical protein
MASNPVYKVKGDFLVVDHSPYALTQYILLCNIVGITVTIAKDNITHHVHLFTDSDEEHAWTVSFDSLEEANTFVEFVCDKCNGED